MVNINQNPPWFRTADRCPYSGLPVSHPEMYVSLHPGTNYFADIVKLGDQILLVKGSGNVRSYEMSEALDFIDAYVSEHFDRAAGLFLMEDYSDIGDVDGEARKLYIHHHKNDDSYRGGIFYNMPLLMKISFNIAKRLHVRDKHLYAVESYKQAIFLALEILSRPDVRSSQDVARDLPFLSVFEKPSEIAKRFYRQISQKIIQLKHSYPIGQNQSRAYSESLLRYIESIDWHKDGMENPENRLFTDPNVRKVAESIGYIKSEVDGLLRERDAAGEILRQSEARYRRLVEHAKAGILEFDYETHRIISVNESFLKICGYSKNEITRLAPEDLMTAPSRKLFLDRLENRMKGSPLQDDAIYEFFTKNGEKKWVLLTATVFEAANRPQKADIIIIDITPMKMVEARLMEYQGRLKALSMALSRAEEGERRNLASHLHEKVGQELFVAQLRLAAMKKTLTTPIQHQHLDAVNEQIVKTIQEIRGITYDLSPPVLYELGLADALSSLARTLKTRHGLKIELTVKGDAEKCHDEIKHIFYRAAREILHNTVKHARADEAGIYLEITEHDLFMDISDNGVGFDTAPFSENHYTGQGFGFFDIREKVQNLGGSLHICSTPGEGTRVSLAVPLSLDPA